MATALTPLALQGFRAVFVSAVEVSTALALTVTGGVRQRTIPITLGPATWTSVLAMWPETTAISEVGFLCVV